MRASEKLQYAAMQLSVPTSGMNSINSFPFCQLKRPTCTGGRGGEAQGLADLKIFWSQAKVKHSSALVII